MEDAHVISIFQSITGADDSSSPFQIASRLYFREKGACLLEDFSQGEEICHRPEFVISHKLSLGQRDEHLILFDGIRLLRRTRKNLYPSGDDCAPVLMRQMSHTSL